MSYVIDIQKEIGQYSSGAAIFEAMRPMLRTLSLLSTDLLILETHRFVDLPGHLHPRTARLPAQAEVLQDGVHVVRPHRVLQECEHVHGAHPRSTSSPGRTPLLLLFLLFSLLFLLRLPTIVNLNNLLPFLVLLFLFLKLNLLFSNGDACEDSLELVVPETGKPAALTCDLTLKLAETRGLDGQAFPARGGQRADLFKQPARSSRVKTAKDRRLFPRPRLFPLLVLLKACSEVFSASSSSPSPASTPSSSPSTPCSISSGCPAVSRLPTVRLYKLASTMDH